MKIIDRGDKLFWARIVPCCCIYEVHDLIIRTVGEDYFVGVDKHDKHAYLLGFNTLDDVVFEDRKRALSKVHTAEKNRIEVDLDVCYEEY